MSSIPAMTCAQFFAILLERSKGSDHNRGTGKYIPLAYIQFAADCRTSVILAYEPINGDHIFRRVYISCSATVVLVLYRPHPGSLSLYGQVQHSETHAL